jgi:hypothetical protein
MNAGLLKSFRELYPPASIVGGKITISAFGTRSGRTAVLLDTVTAAAP